MVRRTPSRTLLALGAAVVLVVSLVVVRQTVAQSSAEQSSAVDVVPPPTAVPLSVTAVDTGSLSVPWDIEFAPDGTMVYDQRWGAITARPPNQPQRVLATPEDFPDLVVRREGGLLGLAVDPDFANPDGQHRRLYTCETTMVGGEPFNQVRRWRVDADWTRATRDATILADATATPTELGSGLGPFHAGCRLLFDRKGRLLVSVGDAGVGRFPQDTSVLAGKVLRITTDGAPAKGNPSLGGDRRIWTLGHRNPQGLALQPRTGAIWETEHGPSVDDEVNRLVGGSNYGWNPLGADGQSYDESVPMTAAGATAAKYSTGDPTLALSGATFLSGAQWGAWNGALVVVTLKTERVLVFGVKGQQLSTPVVPTELDGTFGRLRAAKQGPDGALYVATNDVLDADGRPVDKILRITPRTVAASRSGR